MDNGFKVPDQIDPTNSKVNRVKEDSFLETPKVNKAIEIDNMLSDKSDQATNSNFFIYILIFLVVAAVAVTYFVYQNQLADTNLRINNLDSKIIKSNTPVSINSNSQAISDFALPTFGLKILVPSQYSDLTTVTGTTTVFSATPTQAVFLSSKAITKSDINCTASSSVMGGSPLGIISQINGTYPSNINVSSGVLLLQTKSYYIAYMPPTTSCSSNKNTLALINEYRYNLHLNSSTVSLSN